MKEEQYNDYELLYLIDLEDEEAFCILREKYRPICLALCRDYYKEEESMVVSFEDYLSICESSLMKAVRGFDEKKNVTFYTFFLICLTSSLKLVKRKTYQKKNRSLLEHSPYDYEIEDYYQEKYRTYEVRDQDPEKIYQEKQLEKIVKSYLYQAEPFASHILQLRINGFQYKEIATLLNTTTETVTKSLKHSRYQLKEYLKIDK